MIESNYGNLQEASLCIPSISHYMVAIELTDNIAFSSFTLLIHASGHRAETKYRCLSWNTDQKMS